MEDKERDALIMYRLAKANEALDEAGILLDAAAFPGAVNRAYYSMFHSLSAVAAYKGHEGKTHSGLIRWFDLEFIAAGVFEKQYSRDVHNAFRKRMDADYTDFAQIAPSQAAELVLSAGDFLHLIEKLIKNKD